MQGFDTAFRARSFKRLAVSCVLVLCAANAAVAQGITINGSSGAIEINLGDTMTASAGSGATTTDWVGLYRVGAIHQHYLEWWYLNGTTSAPASPVSNSILEIPMNRVRAGYELRKFLNNGYSLLGQSGVVTIRQPRLTVNGEAAPQTISAEPGASIQVDVISAQGSYPASDWVGIYRIGAPSTAWLDWVYLHGTRAVPSGGLHSGNFSMTVPNARGPYELRLSYSSGFDVMATGPTSPVKPEPAPPVVMRTRSSCAPTGGVGVRPQSLRRIRRRHDDGQDDAHPGCGPEQRRVGGGRRLPFDGTDRDRIALRVGRQRRGAVGDGTNIQRLTPTLLSLTDVVAIAAGDHHSVALTSSGQVFTWGLNASGALGNGTTTNSNVPIQVATGAIAIGAGDHFTLFVKTDQTVWGMGANQDGTLGDGTYTNRTSPVQMSGVSAAVAVSGGRNHSLALRSDGTVLATGRNTVGQMGDSTATDRWRAGAVPTLTNIVGIAAGKDFSVALDKDGVVRGWGDNGLGQLGTSTPSYRTTAATITGLSGTKFLAAGKAHVIALDANNAVMTFGENAAGALGDGTTTNRATPEVSYGFSGRVATPTFSVASGTYTSDFNVVVSNATDGSTMRYTQNGSEPTASDPTVASGSSIAIGQSQTLKVTAWKAGTPSSAVGSVAYEMKVATPWMSPPAGSYSSAAGVTLATATAGAVVRYTVDGSEPTTSSPQYTSSISVSHTTTVKAIGFKSNWSDSDLNDSTFVMNFGTLSAPTVEPAGGTYTNPFTVTMSSSQSGATIRYTTNGEPPTASSTAYASPLSLSGTVTVRAKAFHLDFATSAETGRAYNPTDTDDPTLTASIFPAAVGGWNNTPATVSFECQDNVGIASCSSPTTVSTEGTNQQVTGVAVDLVGTQETLEVFVDIDFTPPQVELTDPAGPLTTSQATIELSALVSDALSGIHSATCDGTAATLDSGTASCTVSLGPGRNDVVLAARDLAGNVTSTSIRISRTGTATAFELAPTERRLVVDETTTLRLVDNFGVTVSGATWSSDDPAIVDVSVDDPPLLTATQAGTVTITATKNGLSAEASITVLAGTSLPYGTAQWSLVVPETFLQVIKANRVGLSVPDLFSIESTANATIVRGITAAGDVLWQTTAPGRPLMGDSFGGLVAGIEAPIDPLELYPQQWYTAYVRFAGPEGSPGWRFDSMGKVGRPAQALDGTIYALERYATGDNNLDGSPIIESQLIVLDGANGVVRGRYALARDQQILGYGSTCGVGEKLPSTLGPIVGTDGHGYVLVRRSTASGSCPEMVFLLEASFTLLKVSPSGVVLPIPLHSQSCPSAMWEWCSGLPSLKQLVPDGIGGMLVRTEHFDVAGSGFPQFDENRVTRIVDGAIAFSTVVGPQHPMFQEHITMIGGSGTAFIRKHSGVGLVDVTNLSTLWSAPNSALAPVATMREGRFAMHDLVAGTLTEFNADGTPIESAAFGGAFGGGFQTAFGLFTQIDVDSSESNMAITGRVSLPLDEEMGSFRAEGGSGSYQNAPEPPEGRTTDQDETAKALMGKLLGVIPQVIGGQRYEHSGLICRESDLQHYYFGYVRRGTPGNSPGLALIPEWCTNGTTVGFAHSHPGLNPTSQFPSGYNSQAEYFDVDATTTCQQSGVGCQRSDLWIADDYFDNPNQSFVGPQGPHVMWYVTSRYPFAQSYVQYKKTAFLQAKDNIRRYDYATGLWLPVNAPW